MSERGFIELQHEFTRYLRDPERMPKPSQLQHDERLAVYGNAVYANIERFMRDNFPRVHAALSAEHWAALIRDYIMAHRSDTPLFVELLNEFLDYLENERDPSADPPFLVELAHFDWLENAIGTDLRRLDDIAVAAEGDLLRDPLVVNPIHRVVIYRYPVHAGEECLKLSAPPARATHLVAFRDRQDAYGVLDLNHVAVQLLLGIRDRKPLSALQVLEEMAQALGHADPAVVVRGGLSLIERWHARGLILGFAPTD